MNEEETRKEETVEGGEQVASSVEQGKPDAEAPAVSKNPKDVEEGKAFAILSYALGFIGIPFFLIPLITRNNDFSLFHAKQCLMLWLFGIIGGTISGILMIVCIGVVLMIFVGIAGLVLNIIGLINAIIGERKPLPWIGSYAEEWFKGLKLVE